MFFGNILFSWTRTGNESGVVGRLGSERRVRPAAAAVPVRPADICRPSPQILKREWPRNWDSFITDIVGSSKANEALCHNNMHILALLSEEVFDFSAGKLTQAKAKHLKDTMCSEFSQIFQLCQFVMVSGEAAARRELRWESGRGGIG